MAMCACASLMLAYIEALLPPLVPAVPGIKAGLANIMSLFVLYRCGTRSAASVCAVRITLAALLFGGVWPFFYSAAGALFSLSSMHVLKKTRIFSPVGVSIAGGIAHNVGQIAFAAATLGTSALWLYMPVLLIAGTLSGTLVGVSSAFLLRYLKSI